MKKKYLNDCIDSTFVSSVGKYVDSFEKEFAKTVGSKFAIATVNGTAASSYFAHFSRCKKR